MKRIMCLILSLALIVGAYFVLPVTAEQGEGNEDYTSEELTQIITDNSTEEASSSESVTEESTAEETTTGEFSTEEETTDGSVTDTTNSTEPETTESETTVPVITVPSTAPVIKKLYNATSGLALVWDGVNGADSYRIYRRGAGEKYWTYLETVSGCDFVDKKVVSGRYYRYTVRACNSAGFGAYDTVGVYTKRIVNPFNIKASNGNGFISVSWSIINGATGYRVYRRAAGQSYWTYLGNVTKGYYEDSKINGNTYYRYTVIATCGKVYSDFYPSGSLVKSVFAPVPQKVVTRPAELTFSWSSVGGATSYRVYRRGAGQNYWTYLGAVNSLQFTDKNIVKGQYYRYTVRAVSSGYFSGFDTQGVLLKYMGVNGQTVYGKNADYLRAGTINNPTIIGIDPQLWNLTVVNAGYRIPGDYTPNLTYVCGSGERLDRQVAVHYERMYNAAARDGVYLTPCSGYRSYELQERNYNRKIAYYESLGYSNADARVLAAKVIMPPGSSEHNLGYAMDIVCVEEWFENTAEFRWLKENASDYGFIMRYPKEKQHITNVIYEPWHWRYVGVEAAKAIESSGLVLEEYMGLV